MPGKPSPVKQSPENNPRKTIPGKQSLENNPRKTIPGKHIPGNNMSGKQSSGIAKCNFSVLLSAQKEHAQADKNSHGSHCRTYILR